MKNTKILASPYFQATATAAQGRGVVLRPIARVSRRDESLRFGPYRNKPARLASRRKVIVTSQATAIINGFGAM
jgi:hypothetical protein